MRLFDALTKRWRERLKYLPTEGFGQSFADDLRFILRFRRCSRQVVDWRLPTDEERHLVDHHPILGRFGDITQLVADVGSQKWVVRDRDWHGWPDPPQHVFFALEGETICVARDFDSWPSAWLPDPDDRRKPQMVSP